MALDRFMIMPLQTGLETDQKPWQLLDDAFAVLQNAYVFRSTLRKRFGTVLMGTIQQSRFRVQVGTIGAPLSPVPGSKFAIGQSFSAGSQIFTVITLGTPAAMLATGPGTGTFNTTTGAFTLAGTGLAAGTAIFWYPGLPVMGLTQYEIGSINNHPSFGFDTEFAYKYTPNVGWDRFGTGLLPIWHGTDSQFFWATNWDGLTPDIVILFVTNFNAHIGLGLVTDDPIWTLNGTVWTPFYL